MRPVSLCLRIFRFIVLDIVLLVLLFVIFTQLPSPLRPSSYAADTLLSGRTLHMVYNHEKFNGNYQNGHELFVLDYRFEFDVHGQVESIHINDGLLTLANRTNDARETLVVEKYAGDPEGVPEFILPGPGERADTVYAVCLVNWVSQEYFRGYQPYDHTMRLGIKLQDKSEGGKRLDIHDGSWAETAAPLLSLHLPIESASSISFPSPPAALPTSSLASTRFIIILIAMAHMSLIWVVINIPTIFGFLVYIMLYLGFICMAIMGIIVFVEWFKNGRPKIRLEEVRGAARQFMERASGQQGQEMPKDLESGNELQDTATVLFEAGMEDEPAKDAKVQHATSTTDN